MEKINVAELLRNCPKGMELDCTMFEGVYFDHVDESRLNRIKCYVNNGDEHFEIEFEEYGQYISNDSAKCVIFPKGKTTWEGFVPPCQFKDGDILATDLGSVFYLNTRLNTDECYGCYVGIGGDGSFHICEPFAYKECCGLATEKEKQKLFQAIKDNGYKWNAETKTLEKLPKFKVGDRVKHKRDGYVFVITSVDIEDSTYYCGLNAFWINDQDDFELVPTKFDITTLKPFDKVLMRSSNAREWVATIYSHYSNNKFYGCGMCCDQCIPYKGNEYLLGTTNDCDEYFKTWK